MSIQTELGLLKITGEHTKQFLQGQLTCDVNEVTASQSQLGAHCNPQGRIISFFRLFTKNGDYYLQMPRELIPIAMSALQKYAVFFKTILTDVSDDSTYASDWKKRDIEQGIPAIYPETSEKFLPHDLNLPQLNAVSFTKGCYTGQEIIARMQYRGKLKKHLYRATVHTTLPLKRGSDIYLEGKSCGNIVDFCEMDNNRYELLVIAQEEDIQTQSLTIDAEKKYFLEVLNPCQKNYEL